MLWPTANAALICYAAQVLLAEPEPVTVLGIDETRRGTPRWEQDADTGEWSLVVDHWHIGFVDISGDQGLLGHVEGRNSTTVATGLAAHPHAGNRPCGTRDRYVPDVPGGDPPGAAARQDRGRSFSPRAAGQHQARRVAAGPDLEDAARPATRSSTTGGCCAPTAKT
jgi:hypothetical protein